MLVRLVEVPGPAMPVVALDQALTGLGRVDHRPIGRHEIAVRVEEPCVAGEFAGFDQAPVDSQD